MTSREIVLSIYRDFQAGNIPAILERLSPDVDWEYGAADSSVPWLQHRRGVQGAVAFFEALRELEFHAFDPHTVLAEGNLVVGLINLEATVLRTGVRVVEEDEVHLWKLDETGRVIRFRHRCDTLAHHRAWGE